MRGADLVADGFDRVHDIVHRVVHGLTEAQLAFRADDEANSIGWLVWHLTRIQDDHLADLAGSEQVWLADGWFERMELPFDRSATGYGHQPADVTAVRVPAGTLLDYHNAVHARTIGYLRELADEQLPRIVDTSWTPPVTLAVRLVSMLSDNLQHAGQAAFVRGLVQRAAPL